MTITPKLNTTTNMQNSSLKKDEIENNNQILNEQTRKEKSEPKTNYYGSFLGTNLDIKV